MSMPGCTVQFPWQHFNVLINAASGCGVAVGSWCSYNAAAVTHACLYVPSPLEAGWDACLFSRGSTVSSRGVPQL